MPTFTIGEADFLLDGRPHRILSGAIHYFRVHPEQWADRIRKAREMGLNAIETYVAWNAHERHPGEWDAGGWNDLGRFLDLIAAEGLHAIVRPGPYICAEWHNGGLPVWLTREHEERLRSSDPAFLADVGDYLRRVYEIVAPRQIDRGGPVILVQIENEYGAYGSDKEYLAELARTTRDAGITVPLTTVDQPHPRMLEAGGIPGLHKTASFGSHSIERLATLREHQPSGPLMCMEFWDGWFDWWGGHHHTTSARAAAAELDALLSTGASVNIYMFHGGTNFGLTNGANDKGRYLPIATSYDYDAPLDEAGNITEKYRAFRDVLARYADVPSVVPSEPAPSPSLSVDLHRAADRLWDAADDGRTYPSPPTFDDLDHLSALIRYETTLEPSDFGTSASAILEIGEVRDFAWAFLDGSPIGTLSRSRHERSLVVPGPGRLTLLVEDQGRVNYDTRIGEPKGLIGPVRIGGQSITGWRAAPIDVERLATEAREALPGGAADADRADAQRGPVALSASFSLDQVSDLYLDTDGWGRGYAFVNGFFLGRYWSVGPQRTLYVPAPVTRRGANDVVVVEIDHLVRGTARFVSGPQLGPHEE